MNPIVTEAPKQARDRSLAKARAVLNEGNHRLVLIVGILTCIVATVAVAMIVSAFDVAFDFVSLMGEPMAVICMSLSQSVLCFFLVYPLYLGLFRMALGMSRGEPVDVAQLFGFYSSFRMLWRAWRIQLRILWNSFPLLLISASSYVSLFSEIELIATVVLPVLGLVEPLLLFWGLYSSSRIFPFAMLALKEPALPLREAMKRAKTATRGRAFAVCAMRIRLIWRFLLSLLSIGVVTLLHVLPLTLLAYSEYSTELTKDNQL